MTNPWSYALHVGFFAGLIWWLAGVALHFFGFTEVRPAFMAEPWADRTFLASWNDHFTGLLAYTVFSMLAALLYAAVLRKAKGPWPGILYGLAWYLVLFFGIGPFAGMLPAYSRLAVHSHVSELSRFLLWGAFIGYSITLEFTDERMRESGLG